MFTAREVQARSGHAIRHVTSQLRPLRSATITINGTSHTSFPPAVPDSPQHLPNKIRGTNKAALWPNQSDFDVDASALRHLGLELDFQVVVCKSEVGIEKEYPDVRLDRGLAANELFDVEVALSTIAIRWAAAVVVIRGQYRPTAP